MRRSWPALRAESASRIAGTSGTRCTIRLEGARTRRTPKGNRNVLLELDASVHGEQSVILVTHASKKIAVIDASPATSDDGGGTVAFEHRDEVSRELLVKKNAHQPAV